MLLDRDKSLIDKPRECISSRCTLFFVSNNNPCLYTLHPTPYTITFIKIAVSFTSLIPSLIPPRELRETTEGTPKEDHMTKKALFLRLNPKKVDSIPETVDLHFSPLHPKPEKSRQKTIFLAHLEKKAYLCERNCKLQRKSCQKNY